ncbi:valine--tRNA ligase [Peptoniphilus sp. KCTC 25270]|uniref:valine--tRNA ligase n=1 Tax=Peptoniphilus sp. KCTC 25270 TaxID=2897414 RepID=UPI001E3AEA57|nr:valine--tRNA ligase [Peptoniphilus sp. KCTC 25270]MCD1148001.1 valine--tRNA ligase [Peptoniphilus sp. KCTC 25270]
MDNMKKVYDPKTFEDRIYSEWMEKGYFRPEIDENKKPYTIMMPPPNVTGNLHMGHAMNNTLQDILIRYKRMAGYSALWVPGTDHASISTEAKVVQKIKEEGKSKEGLGREGFLEEAWAWTEKYGGNIKNQLKKLGVSCDWSRERFTLDEELSYAVEEVFIRLYEKGLIYRGDRIINWCPSCKTAISDAEVEHVEGEGKIWTFKYPIEDSDEFLSISTTRPETIPGDLAVAVNPEDERYAKLVGKHVILPVLERRIPIVADDYVDVEFGTGAVKITPSHDPNDFEVGERHNLGQLLIMDELGYLNENAGKYNGMERYEARKAIIKDFDELGLFVEEKVHNNAIGHCERCKTVIEPILSKQWFVEMKPLAEPALKAYRDGNLDFIPERFGKIYVHWLENIRDWCISRQLWWGHRLPVYYCNDCGEVIVSRDEHHKCTKCGSENLRQDEDTLDTWFSSALWPFSTLGWPKKTPDFDFYYPTDVLVTGYDIIFFWVIRMVFSAIELTDQLPFKDVYLTGLVRDEQGRKMSKSLGNGIDPLDIIADYGADALRFTLVTGNSAGNDLRFSIKRVEANRNFANKLWNASRFVLMNLPEDMKEFSYNVEDLRTEDKWILHQARETIASVETKLDKYDIGLAADAIQDFIWEDYCDWYIELVKPRLYGDDTKDREVVFGVLIEVLETILKLLHPFMPYITEEIWNYLPNRQSALIVSQWPKSDAVYEKEKKEIEYIQKAVKGLRNAKAEMEIEPHRKSKLIVLTEDEEIEELFQRNAGHLSNLGNITEIERIKDRKAVEEDVISVVVDKAELFLPMSDLVDYAKELERLEKEEEKTQSEIKRAEKKLGNENFVAKANPEVVEQEKAKLESYKKMLETIEERLAFVKGKVK